LPEGWVVFPLLRTKVITGLVGWAFGALIGFGLLALISTIVIPYNYQRGFGPALVTTIFLGVLLFVGAGSIWTFINDFRRLRQQDKHIIVITPEDFVQQAGDKIIHVPLINIRHVTARGLPPPDRSSTEVSRATQIPSSGENTLGFLMGRAFMPSGMLRRRMRMRTPTTLAFLDTRTDNEIIVVNDNSYGDPYAIAVVVKNYAASMQQLVR
jgi:hypothetical protein